MVPWDDSAFAVRHREAEAARERFDRLLGREPEIEPPGLELDIGW